MTRYSLSLSYISRGFALVESLVALSLMVLVIVSSSQLYSFIKQESQYTYQQLRAYQATEDLARRIQLNTTQWSAYAGKYKEVVASRKSCMNKRCTPVELRHWDIEQWLTQLIDHIKLPQAQACIAVQAQKLTISVTWLSYLNQVFSNEKQHAVCSETMANNQGVQLSIIMER
tara:strand:+ start:1681 stop:2199 length:519 start_codon:yes stop_codon:yes gene_type:complete